MVSNGLDTAGKQIRMFRTFIPPEGMTEAKARKAAMLEAERFEADVKADRISERLKFGVYAEIWMRDYCRESVAPTTYDRNRIAIDQLMSVFGHLYLDQLTPLQIQRGYMTIKKNGYTKGGIHREYSVQTIRRLHQVLSSSLSTAVRWGKMPENPCNRVVLPRDSNPDKSVKSLTDDETDSFLRFLEEPYAYVVTRKNGQEIKGTKMLPLQYRIFLKLVIFGSFRREELIPLKWSDIDQNSCTITIRRAAARVKDQGLVIKDTKTKGSRRSVTIPKELIEELQELKRWQDKLRYDCGTKWEGNDENWVFIQSLGKMMDLSSPNKVMRETIKRYNASHEDQLPQINIHGLRHTSATLLIANNVDIRTVSARLGHSNTSTTMNIYAHALRKKDQEAADVLAAIFEKK